MVERTCTFPLFICSGGELTISPQFYHHRRKRSLHRFTSSRRRRRTSTGLHARRTRRSDRHRQTDRAEESSDRSGIDGSSRVAAAEALHTGHGHHRRVDSSKCKRQDCQERYQGVVESALGGENEEGQGGCQVVRMSTGGRDAERVDCSAVIFQPNLRHSFLFEHIELEVASSALTALHSSVYVDVPREAKRVSFAHNEKEDQREGKPSNIAR